MLEQALPPLSLVWVGADAAAPTLVAGTCGATILVLQFPRRNEAAEAAPARATLLET